MQLFLAAEGHRLTKSEICETLWPKKDDPNDTLYTLIRRTKQALGEQTQLRIENERGEAYRLRKR